MKKLDARDIYNEAKQLGNTITIKQLYDLLKRLPERTGKWIRGDKTLQCSECKTVIVNIYDNRTPYCPYCGVKMKTEIKSI